MKKVLFILTMLILSGCSQTSWTAFYYPDGTAVESTWKQQAGFETKAQCLDWIDAEITEDKSNNDDRVFDYECGKNCRFRDEYQLNVCETTEK